MAQHEGIEPSGGDPGEEGLDEGRVPPLDADEHERVEHRRLLSTVQADIRVLGEHGGGAGQLGLERTRVDVRVRGTGEPCRNREV